jgi:hypothetical protein
MLCNKRKELKIIKYQTTAVICVCLFLMYLSDRTNAIELNPTNPPSQSNASKSEDAPKSIMVTNTTATSHETTTREAETKTPKSDEFKSKCNLLDSSPLEKELLKKLESFTQKQ